VTSRSLLSRMYPRVVALVFCVQGCTVPIDELYMEVDHASSQLAGNEHTCTNGFSLSLFPMLIALVAWVVAFAFPHITFNAFPPFMGSQPYHSCCRFSLEEKSGWDGMDGMEFRWVVGAMESKEY